MNKRLIALFLCCMIIVSALPFSGAADTADEAQQVDIRAYPRSGYDMAALHDGKYRTYESFYGDRQVTVASDTPFSRLYILWDEMPGEWILSVNGKETTQGLNGYVHEFIELDEPVTEATFYFRDNAPRFLCEVYAFTAGQLPDWVQVWTPPCEKADLLVIPTHSDDEFVFFGGILPYYAGELGLEVQVAYMVDHKYTERFRWHELLNSLWTAGVTHYPVNRDVVDVRHGYLWQAEEFYNRDKTVEFQVELLRRFKPLVVVDHDEGGEYGHSAHILNALCIEDAITAAADSSMYPASAEQYGTWDTPKLYLHLYEEGRITMDFETPLEHFGGLTAFEVAEKAFACCETQITKTYHVYETGSDYDCHLFGLYRSTVGEDTGLNDIFENIDSSKLLYCKH